MIGGKAILGNFFHVLNRNSFSCYCASLVYAERRKKESQKIDLSVLATCWSGTSAMLSNKVNGPVAYGNT